MQGFVKFFAPFLVLCAIPGAAHAEWREAQSAHFVVYADDDEDDIYRFSSQLELYHAAMEVMTGTQLPSPSPSNRVTVFVVKNEREVQRLMGGGARYISGFYLPRAAGSVAFVPKVRTGSGDLDFSMLVLLHEYAHHFLISNSGLPMPRWVNEGAAEFFASSEFPREGGIKIGLPARHRAGEILFGKDVKLEDLLDPGAYADGVSKGFDSFYGKSWLLYHFLSMTSERRGQLRQYLTSMANGMDSLSAGQQAFGDFKKLEKELDRYTRQRILTAHFKPGTLEIGNIDVRELREGEAEVLPLRMRSKRGVTREQAVELLTDVREVARQYPEDAAVLAELAEAEYDAGNDDAAIAAADAALAIAPDTRNALVQKGFALFRKAGDADNEDFETAIGEAMKPFLALNHLENDNPLPLIYNFRSFAERGVKPDDTAVHGLERASQLAPFDLGLKMQLASYELATGEIELARFNLVPIAYNPHGGSQADAARATIDLIDSGEKDGPTLQAALFAAPTANSEGEDG